LRLIAIVSKLYLPAIKPIAVSCSDKKFWAYVGIST
jgi:hypothetical protein